MNSEPEIDRIRRIYAAYDASAAAARKRDRLNAGNVRRMDELRETFENIVRGFRGDALGLTEALDVGCGAGEMLGWLRELGVPAVKLVGIDLLSQRIDVARATHPDVRFVCGNAEDSSLVPGPFDLIVCSTLFSSILDEGVRARLGGAITARLRLGGAVLWYDLRYPNPFNRNVIAMTRARISSLFPGLDVKLNPISLLPPIGRRLGATTGIIYPALSRVPLARSHLIGLLMKRT